MAEALVIQEVQDDGASVIMKGGSLWRLAPSSRTTVRQWPKKAKVSLEKNKNNAQYPFLLVYGHEDAEAQLVGKM